MKKNFAAKFHTSVKQVILRKFICISVSCAFTWFLLRFRFSILVKLHGTSYALSAVEHRMVCNLVLYRIHGKTHSVIPNNNSYLNVRSFRSARPIYYKESNVWLVILVRYQPSRHTFTYNDESQNGFSTSLASYPMQCRNVYQACFIAVETTWRSDASVRLTYRVCYKCRPGRRI
jgi:hypothetical protein